MAPASDDDAAPQSPGSAVSVSLSDGPAHSAEPPHSPPGAHQAGLSGPARHADEDVQALGGGEAAPAQPRSSFDVVSLDDGPSGEGAVQSDIPNEPLAEAARRESVSASPLAPAEEAEPPQLSEHAEPAIVATPPPETHTEVTPRSTSAALGHRRFESVPPERFDLPESSVAAHGPPAELDDVSEGDEDAEWAPRITTRRYPSSGSERAHGFVDVELDSAGPSRAAFSPYGPGAAYGTRSSVEVRQDSISSNSSTAKAIAAAAAHRERMRERHGQQSSFGAESGRASGDSVEVARQRVASLESNGERRRSSLGAQATGPESARPERMGEQRAARLSAGRDRHAGDEQDPTRLGQLKRRDLAPINTGATMLVAGEDGEINIVLSPASNGSLHSPEIGRMEAVSLDDETGEDAQRGAHESGLEERVGPEQTPPAVSGQDDASAGPPDHQDAHADEAEAVPTLTDAADSAAKPGHARRASQGPSALEQHISRTRMTNLPPKARAEDVKHLSDFEEMMKLYKQTERRRQELDEERKRRKDAELAAAQSVWSDEILPSWTRARREARLRQVWWRGAPPNLRGRVWALACGNAQMLPRNLFTSAAGAARTARADGTFPAGDDEAIEADIASTLPSLKLFQRDTGPLFEDLRDVLSAYVMVRLDQLARQREPPNVAQGPIAYCAGAASLAAMLLANLTPSETLVALLNLLAERPWLRALYAPAPAPAAPGDTHLHTKTPSAPAFRQDAAAGFERVFDTLLADQMPKVYANMQARGVRPSAYVRDWVRTLFVPFLPFDAVARLWDCILLEEGDALIFRAGLAIVKLLSARLYAPDRAELTSILRGNNAAALRVFYRDASMGLAPAAVTAGVSVPAEHGVAEPASSPAAMRSVEADPAWVPKDNVYAQYGIGEEQLFAALEEQNEWWRDSTLERLLDRELSG